MPAGRHLALPPPHTRPALFTNGSLEYAHTLIARYHAISIHASTRALFPNIFSSPEDDSRGKKDGNDSPAVDACTTCLFLA